MREMDSKEGKQKLKQLKKFKHHLKKRINLKKM